jgi:glutamate-1-semialdehyde aminotransferase
VSTQARSLAESARLVERARGLVPAWTQTLSKNPTQWVQGVAPAYVARAKGAHVWDVDGNRYVDFPMALGPVIVGHADDRVNAAIAAQLADGITYTLPHPVELDVAERIVARVPGAERVRFGKSGSDANSAAIRLARAITGRDHVLVAGYHGWHDWYVATTTRDIGVPAAVAELTGTFTYGDLGSLDAALAAQAGDTAAVILEPSGATLPPEGFLAGVVQRAHAAGARVVFDEIITGFRLGPGGAQERYGVRADLVTFGKALGNGMPISAIAGRAELMDVLDEVFFSGTHGGEALSLAAARAVLDVLAAEPVHAHLWRLGGVLQTGLRSLIAAHGLAEWVTCSGEPPWTLVLVREPDAAADGLPAKTLLQQELVKRGVLYNGSHFVSWAHTDADVELTLAAYDEAFTVLAAALPDGVADALEGPPLRPVFR